MTAHQKLLIYHRLKLYLSSNLLHDMIRTILTTILILAAQLSFSQSADEKAVASAVTALTNGMLQGDQAVLNDLTAAELSYGHSSGVIEDKATFVDALVSRKSHFTEIDITDQSITIAGNTALVRHTLRGVVNGANVNLGILLVWQKQKGKWKLLARQAFRR